MTRTAPVATVATVGSAWKDHRPAGHDAQQNEHDCVVVHDERGPAPEAPKRLGTSKPPRVDAVAVFPPQRSTHKQHVRHSAENGVREDRDLRRAHFRPKRRTVAKPRVHRLRYQKSTRRRIRTGPGRSIVRLQDP